MGGCVSCPGGSMGGVDVRAVDRSKEVSRKGKMGTGTGPSRARSMVSSTDDQPPPVPDFGVSSRYHLLNKLGEGGTGSTWLCQDIKTAQRVAIKFIPRPLAKVLIPMVSQEILLQAQLSEGHLGLVRMETALLSCSHIGLVMEYVDGGTLTQYVSRRTAGREARGGLFLEEDEARYFFRQLISAVDYLHKQHVAHRDLKMCNVVLTDRRPPVLKLCDFGFAKGWEDDSQMHTRIGTPVYMSPQLIASKHGGKPYSATAADVWACGVMLFAMLGGMFPYDHTGHPNPNSSGAHVEVWMEQMRVGGGRWREAPRVARVVEKLTPECKDLLEKLLELDEEKRITVAGITQHPWFTAALPQGLDEALKDIESKQAKIAAAVKQTTQGQIRRRNAAVHDLVVQAGSLPAPPPLLERDNEGDSGHLSKSNTDRSSHHHLHNSDPTQEASPLRKEFSKRDKVSGRSKPLASLFQDEEGAAVGRGSSEATEESDMGTSTGGVEAAKEGKGGEEGAMDSPPGGSGPSRAEMLGGKTSLQLPAVKLVTLAAYARRTKSDGLDLLPGTPRGSSRPLAHVWDVIASTNSNASELHQHHTPSRLGDGAPAAPVGSGVLPARSSSGGASRSAGAAGAEAAEAGRSRTSTGSAAPGNGSGSVGAAAPSPRRLADRLEVKQIHLHVDVDVDSLVARVSGAGGSARTSSRPVPSPLGCAFTHSPGLQPLQLEAADSRSRGLAGSAGCAQAGDDDAYGVVVGNEEEQGVFVERGSDAHVAPIGALVAEVMARVAEEEEWVEEAARVRSAGGKAAGADMGCATGAAVVPAQG